MEEEELARVIHALHEHADMFGLDWRGFYLSSFEYSHRAEFLELMVSDLRDADARGNA